jgi:hypothetical protein
MPTGCATTTSSSSTRSSTRSATCTSPAAAVGAYTAFKGGHALNNKLLRALLADATAYEIVTLRARGRRAARLRRAGAGLVTGARRGAMLVFRLVFGLLLVAALLCFAMYIGTSQASGAGAASSILKWTLVAALGFFAVLILERLALML